MKKTLDFVELDEERVTKHYPRAFDPIMKKPVGITRQTPIILRSKSPPTGLSRILNGDKNTQIKRYSPRVERYLPFDDVQKENIPAKPPRAKILSQEQRHRNKTELIEHVYNQQANNPIPVPKEDIKTTFIEKVKKGDLEYIASILSKQGNSKPAFDINYKRNDGWTSLHVACEEGHFKIACLLLKHGAQVDATNMFKRTPLHISCIK
jgi:Ankyrin repeats (3 copies)